VRRFLTALAAFASAIALTASAKAQEAHSSDAHGIVAVGSGPGDLDITAAGEALACDTGGCEPGSATIGIGTSDPSAGGGEPARASASVCVLGTCVSDAAGGQPEVPLPDVGGLTCLVTATCDGDEDRPTGDGTESGKGGTVGAVLGGESDSHAGAGTNHDEQSPPAGEPGAGGGEGSPPGSENSGGGSAGSAKADASVTDDSQQAAPNREAFAAAGTGNASTGRALECSAATRTEGPLGSGDPPQTRVSRLGAATGSISAFGWAALGAVVSAVLFAAAGKRLARPPSPKEWLP
jgi:hypothetical protein